VKVKGTETRTVQASFGNVPHRMLDRPYNAINKQLELLWEKAEQC
jgi:hypothetical protein